MTLNKVLNAALSSMINGRHAPCCYRAWVQGEGHVNDGSGTIARHSRADYLVQLTRAVVSEIANMGYAHAYAEPGYTALKHGILLANWNMFPRNLVRILERMGYTIEWSDEWATCDDCSRAFRIHSDSYFWKPAYTQVEGILICHDCATPPKGEDE